MKAYKLFVANEEESRKVQEKAFKLGYRWDSGEMFRHTDKPFLYFEDDAEINFDCCSSYEGFRNDENTYIAVADFLALPEPKPEAPSHEEIKPPIGLRPKSIAYEDRYREVSDAIVRYCNAGISIPYDWYDEYQELVIITGRESADIPPES